MELMSLHKECLVSCRGCTRLMRLHKDCWHKAVYEAHEATQGVLSEL